MANAKKILVTTVSHEISRVTARWGVSPIGICPSCGAKTEFIALDEAVSVSGKPTLEIIRLIVTGRIHANETASGHLLACRKSLHKVLLKKEE
jgi:hypothetical protein